MILTLSRFPLLGSGIPEIKAVLSGFEIPYLLDLRVLGMSYVFLLSAHCLDVAGGRLIEVISQYRGRRLGRAYKNKRNLS